LAHYKVKMSSSMTPSPPKSLFNLRGSFTTSPDSCCAGRRLSRLGGRPSARLPGIVSSCRRIQILRPVPIPQTKGRSRQSAAPFGNKSALELSAGRGRDRGHERDHGRDHPSRGLYANDGRLRPTTCVRATSSTLAPRAIVGARLPLACFPIRGARRLRAADDRLLRCAAGTPIHRREPPVRP
jgi:hypothetical protein